MRQMRWSTFKQAKKLIGCIDNNSPEAYEDAKNCYKMAGGAAVANMFGSFDDMEFINHTAQC